MGVALTTFDQALEYLFARTTSGFKFGLDRTVALLRALGDPQDAFPSIHIAGTNGKGSSAATADALLRGRGLRVGKYTSPHLIDFRERITVDGEPIGAAEVADFVTRRMHLVERLGATFFEATTAMAFEHFAVRCVDVAIIEVGLGGRLDSTNVVLPIAAGVTSIGYDHMEYLGNTLELIAAEKAGIFKRGRPAVIGETDARIRAVLASEAGTRGAVPVRVVADHCSVADVKVDHRGTSFTAEMGGARVRLQTPLLGRHQAANVAFTLVLLNAAGPPFATSLAVSEHLLASVSLPGRFQQLGPFILDVAHNPAGSAVLVQTLSTVSPPRPIAALLSVLGDKDWRLMIRTLAGEVTHFVLTVPPTAPASRVWNLTEVARFAREEGLSVDVIADFDAALDRAQSRGRTILITGSFHTVGDAMARLPLSPGHT